MRKQTKEIRVLDAKSFVTVIVRCKQTIFLYCNNWMGLRFAELQWFKVNKALNDIIETLLADGITV